MVSCAVGYLDNTASPAEGIHSGMKRVLSTESDGGGSGRSLLHGTSTIATLLCTYHQNAGQDIKCLFWTRNHLLNFIFQTLVGYFYY
jgi:hypothetical protein